MSQQFVKFVYSIEPDVCKCKEYCKIKTSRTPRNPGCKFWSCARSKENDGCDYFRWAENMIINETNTILSRVRRPSFDGDTSTSHINMKFEEDRYLLRILLKESEEKQKQLKNMVNETKQENDILKRKLNVGCFYVVF